MSLLNSVGTRPASWLAPSTAAAAHAACPAGRPEQEGWAATEQVTSPKVEFGSLGVVVIEGRDVGGSQELPHNLPPNALPSLNITLTLANSRLSDTNLNDGPVLMVLQKPAALNQTTDLSQ